MYLRICEVRIYADLLYQIVIQIVSGVRLSGTTMESENTISNHHLQEILQIIHDENMGIIGTRYLYRNDNLMGNHELLQKWILKKNKAMRSLPISTDNFEIF